MKRYILTALSIALLCLSSQTLSANEVDFERDIAPILEERCSYCHGEDEQESGLRLDQRPWMLKGGDSGLPAIVPGHPEKSYLIEVVKHLDPSVKMPPEEDKIPDEEIALLVQWIREGAVWPGQMDAEVKNEVDLWSFQPVVRPVAPTLNSTSPPANPVDAFLLKKLQEHDLEFSKPADARSLLRRVSIILTGLPPTPETTDEFVAAYSENPEHAYTEAVDRLLDSPQFGERWAQHWLDVIRWAETNGSEANLYRKNAWVYRDYVIRSFNDDKPYDQFLKEQLAGDTMGVGEATGFLVAGPHVPAATVGREPSAIRQARADRMDEIMQTVGASIMGVTIGCARCHNHKFDPVSITDYYAMTAVFQDIEFGSRHPEYSPEHPLRQRGAELWKQIATQRQELRRLGGWEEDWGAYRELHFKPVTTKAIRVRFKMPNVFLDELEVLGPNGQNVNLARDRRGTQVTGFPEAGFENRNPIERLNDGEYGTMIWRAKVEKDEERPWVQFDFAEPETINRLRLSNNREYFYDTDYLDRKPNLPRYEFDVDIMQENGEWQPWVGTWFVNKKLNQDHPERKVALDEIQRLIEQLAEEGPRPSFVGRLIEPEVTRVLLRGSPENPRDEVVAAGPEVLDGDLGMTSDSPGPRRRAAFADWVASPEHPLTARVMVNRIWHHVFGSGIVSTTADFGKAGAPPTHPELLDWLAAEFVEPKTVETTQPWSMKAMIRMLVLSDAFRQSSQPRDDGLAVDAGGQLLWRYPPKRVEAEVIRDAILQVSGNLDLSVGGKSYRIHNEKKTYAQWEVVDNYGPHTWRRMIYQERMRRVDDQLFTAFDFPDCGQVRARRPVSTTPLQALNLMNSEFVLDQSDRIAERARSEAEGDPNRAVDRCFELLLSRSPRPEEREACLPLAKADQLNLVCRALINSNEFAFLP
ncbi:PSD1 and planctomycete cytochrome C domain-containing protein [Rubinisphaera margarita]|uniref:PSD1 and planctomycete cytochrome C domain-containing protein n=1 Tax=Rubinisphaera margarita TaxID=2909586 RepID=UPI001EE95508|nr:PSD1 and planctomycete cytochrome C domain-containing protein [Rubinisphaera margarita]MCG6154391.1 PSD1 and planctomycete cytochrome C domain-containing protein [Rubinisphaera margarita]